MTTIAPAVPATPSQPTADTAGTAQPGTVDAWLRAGTCVLVDVREPDEHARERIAGAILMPLGRFDPAAVQLKAGQTLAIHCRSGRRASDAVARCAGLVRAGIPVVNVAGGIEAWKAAGLPTIANPSAGPRLGVMQQTQLTIGLGILTGLAVGYFAHPAGFLLSAFMAAGLTMAGITGLCPLASAIAKLPWNKGSSCGASCAPKGS